MIFYFLSCVSSRPGLVSCVAFLVIQSGPLIVNPQGTMLSCSYYKDFILSRLASVLLL